MNLGILALIVLIAVIFLGFFRKMNIGIVAIFAATVLGYLSGQFTGKEINGGFSASLFLTLAGVTLLFGIVNETGALELMMSKIIAGMNEKTFPLFPLIWFIFCGAVSAIGPGLIPTAALLTVMSIPIAKATKFDPVMLSIIGVDANAARTTNMTVEGKLITSLLADQGYTESILAPETISCIILAAILSIFVYIFYKGYKVKKPASTPVGIDVQQKFSSKQIVALCGMLVMALLILIFKLETGLAALSVSAVLIFAGIADEGKAVKRIPLNTILLVCGVGVLMNEVITLGGIDVLSNGLASIMTPKTAAGLTGLTAGTLSFFSSTLGVVMPTLIPTVGGIIQKVGGNVTPMEVVSALVFCSSTSGISPASTAGALTMSGVASDPDMSALHPARKLFIQLFAWAIGMNLFVVAAALLGYFRLFG